MTMRGVLFDMGGTLLHYKPEGKEWEDAEKIGALGVYKRLLEHQHILPPEDEAMDKAWAYVYALWNNLDAYDVKQLKLSHQLIKMAEQWGIQNLAPELVESLSEAYMEAIRSHVRPTDGALETLQILKAQGYQIGLVSNTIWPGQVHLEHMEYFGLLPYCDDTIFSSDVDAWKPHADIFEMGLKRLNLQADEAVFVGDSLYFDVWGAKQSGIRAVWIEQPHLWLPDGIQVVPDASIKRLPELIDVLDGWQ